jgi:sialic acid synthase SpsE
MLKGLALPYETFRELYEYAKKKNIEFLSTPFGYADADFLETLGVTAFKVSSGDLTNLPFLAYLGKKDRPVIISTGMATIEEIRDAVKTLEENGCEDLVIMQCTSEYPTPPSHVNLRVLETLRREFRHPIGFSDHTEGTIASPAAAFLGATLIEKHFTLDKRLGGPDHKASLEPRELREMIEKIRGLESGAEAEVPEELLGLPEKQPSEEEKRIAKLVRRGIAARTDIKLGETITQENTHAIRPEGEILPKDWKKIVGKKTTCPIPRGKSLTWDMLEI